MFPHILSLHYFVWVCMCVCVPQAFADGHYDPGDVANSGTCVVPVPASMLHDFSELATIRPPVAAG